jgi:uncharacterized protein YjbI with pentapeptide repeats
MSRESVQQEILGRLHRGQSLDGLGLPSIEGRVDLGGLQLAAPMVVDRHQTAVGEIAQIEPAATFRGVRWQNLDFSGSRLNGMRMFGCELENCRFDNCQLQDLRIWSTTLKQCSFRRSNLRTAALGGIEKGRRNVFSGVDFSGADLRRTAYTAAAFEGCLFANTRLDKVDFQTSTFVDCRFEGELKEVLFYRRGFKGEAFPPNEMRDVDFTRARLHLVEFRGLALDRVRFPEDGGYLVIHNYAAALDKIIASLEQSAEVPAGQVATYLGMARKWAPPGNAAGLLNLLDIAEIAGEELVRRVRALLN